jgi:AraC-like DNA-binding protein
MGRGRHALEASLPEVIHMADLEHLTGFDRWSVYRQFRAVYGVSPYRYLEMRRLDLARRHIACRCSLAEAAIEAGFSDQSHMTRQFKQAYGLSPGRWRSLISASRSSPSSHAR